MRELFRNFNTAVVHMAVLFMSILQYVSFMKSWLHVESNKVAGFAAGVCLPCMYFHSCSQGTQCVCIETAVGQMGNRSLDFLPVWLSEKLKQALSRLLPLTLTHTSPPRVCAPFNTACTDANRRVLGNAFQSDDRWRDTWWRAYRTPVSWPSSSLFVFVGRVRPSNLSL